MKLLDIISNPSFRPADVRDVPWCQINSQLASSTTRDAADVTPESAEWLEEDAGWVKTEVAISVPFHRRSAKPGPHTFVAGDLFHRPLVSVIREKISRATDAQGFHYEPFELHWQPGGSSTKTRVHGELYSSPAFLKVHQELQAAPNEQNCNLPKVVAALMFWSDSTHLTSFGDAKLWPLYLYFGNESKYRRAKPSNHLCEHIAYFQKVSISTLTRRSTY